MLSEWRIKREQIFGGGEAWVPRYIGVHFLSAWDVDWYEHFSLTGE